MIPSKLRGGDFMGRTALKSVGQSPNQQAPSDLGQKEPKLDDGCEYSSHLK